eukprot:gene6266-8630_t
MLISSKLFNNLGKLSLDNRLLAKFRVDGRINLYGTRFSSQSESHSSNFYKVVTFPEVLSAENKNASTVTNNIRGEIIDQAIDLKNIRPGETIDVPYEVTISHSLRDFWQSAFYSHDRINTSTPFARSLGLQDQVVPFNLMLFLAGSMSHADHAKLQVGFSKAKYHWPAFAGDTFKKKFKIISLRSTRDKLHSIFKISCQLINQRNIVVFTCEKSMLFPFEVPPSDVDIAPDISTHNNDFLNHLIQKVQVLQDLGSQTLTSVRPGQLILHTLTRPLSETHSMQLATLARLTHERHFNTRLYRNEELLIPGGLVLGLACSLSSRDLHEVLYEELVECSFPNNLNPGATVGAITFVKSLEEHVSGDIEAIHIRTIGIKNCDVQRALAGKDLPLELFITPLSKLRPAAVEELLKKSCPELNKLVVCIADRKIYRQTPKQTPFLL